MMSPGKYWGEYLGCDFGDNENTGNPQFIINLNIVFREGPTGSWEPVSSPETRTIIFSLTEKARSYSMEKLKRINFNGDFNKPECAPAVKGDAGQMVSGVAVRCKHKEYEGKPKEDWDLVGGGGIKVKEASDDRIRELNAWWQANNSEPAAKTPY